MDLNIYSISLANVLNKSPSIENIADALVVLMLIATIVGIIAIKIKIPYTILLVLVGISMRGFGIMLPFSLTNDLLMIIFLPALLFDAALHFPTKRLKAKAPVIITLTIPCVLLTAFATALFLEFEFSAFGVKPQMGFIHFLLFGAIIAATDPISVISLLKKLGVSNKLSFLIEGESLFNDATALVLYMIIIEAINIGFVSFTNSILKFIILCLGGILWGSIIGVFVSFLISIVEDYLTTIALTTVTAYGTYLIAEKFGLSGILATVTAGLFIGHAMSSKRNTFIHKKKIIYNNKIAVISFWEYIVFFIISIVFLMMGFEVNLVHLINHLDLIILAFFAVMISRAISVFLPIPILNRIGHSVSFKNAIVIWWGGLRGALSMVLVLSLSEEIIARDTLIAMTFGVVLLSLILQGSTMGVLINILGFSTNGNELISFLRKKLARLRAIKYQQNAIKYFSSHEIFLIRKEIADLHIEHANIIELFKYKSNDPSFIKANSLHLINLKRHLKQIAKDSYRNSLNTNLLTEEELSELNSLLKFVKKNIKEKE